MGLLTKLAENRKFRGCWLNSAGDVLGLSTVRGEVVDDVEMKG